MEVEKDNSSDSGEDAEGGIESESECKDSKRGTMIMMITQ